MTAQENLSINSDFQNRTIERLTSGYRINQSGDDAAGLTVANKYRSNIAELTQGVLNANDGASTLQIVDGGLSNISTMLDRLKTLATESASSTFSGDRGILQTEFQNLTSEIDRQAQNIQLNSGGAYNNNLSVYIGGAVSSATSNAQVNVDLSGQAVDSASLGLSGISVAGGGNQINDTGSAPNLNTSALRLNNETETFTVNYTNANGAASTKNVNVVGTSGGVTVANVLSQINTQLNPIGITASVNQKTGALQFSSSNAFSINAGAQAFTDGIFSKTGTVTADNKSLYSATANNAITTTTAGETFVVTNSANQAVTVTMGADTSNAAAVQDINTQIQALGVTASINSSGLIQLSSGSAFTVTGSTAATSGVATGQVFTAATTPTITAPDLTTSATGNALSALTAIQNAVSLLGSVQGKVGAGENKLQYAIDLANSQITNFSAAESKIRDADVAAEAANLTKAQVLQQSSIAAMAQANSAPQAVLKLLQ